MGKENNIKLNTFVEINFADIFESMDNEILADMAENNPKQFKRMCIFLTLIIKFVMKELLDLEKKY